jgi:hypothetical protein
VIGPVYPLPMADGLRALARAERERRVVERLHRVARACDATNSDVGRAWAMWLRTFHALASRHEPRVYEIRHAVLGALAREDWGAVAALCGEHNSAYRDRVSSHHEQEEPK